MKLNHVCLIIFYLFTRPVGFERKQKKSGRKLRLNLDQNLLLSFLQKNIAPQKEKKTKSSTVKDNKFYILIEKRKERENPEQSYSKSRESELNQNQKSEKTQRNIYKKSKINKKN